MLIMGNLTSTRRLTLENTKSSVINVSDDVVQRLFDVKDGRGKGVEVSDNTALELNRNDSVGISSSVCEPDLTSLQKRQETVKNVRKNDEYWKDQMKEMEASQEVLKDIMEKEYDKVINENKFPAMNGSSEEALCVSNTQRVVACYKMYPKETIRCAKEVEDFAQCVNSKHMKMIKNLT